VASENNASGGRPAREKGAVTVPTSISLSPVAFEREERRNEKDASHSCTERKRKTSESRVNPDGPARMKRS